METSEVTNQENASKVSICSLSGLKRISYRCLAQVESLIDQKEWDEKRKMEMKRRLKEMFLHALTENTVLDGEKCVIDGPDDRQPRQTTEFEPFNSESKAWLNSTLYPELDNTIIKTSSKRKHCPFQAVQLLAKQCKHEHNALLKVKTEAKTELEEPIVSAELTQQWQTSLSSVDDVATKLKSSTKTTKKLIDDAEKLSRSLQVSSVVKKSADL